MTSLRSVIAALLADLTYAQNDANILSEHLSVEYRRNSILRYFPVPSAHLDEAEITLRFAFDQTDMDAGTQFPFSNVDPALNGFPSRVLVNDLSINLAMATLANLRATLDGQMKSENETKVTALSWRLTDQSVRNTLAHNLMIGLQDLLPRWQQGRTQEQVESEARRQIRYAILATFDKDEDLPTVIGPLKAWVEHYVHGEAGARMASLVYAAAKSMDRSGDAPKGGASVRIRSTVAELSDVPDFMVQTIRLKARLRDYKWVIVEQGQVGDDQLLPEG